MAYWHAIFPIQKWMCKTNDVTWIKYHVSFFLQFLLIFRKANAGELEAGSGLMDLFENMTEIDVEKEGVKGAKNFFQAKVSYKDN